MDLYKITNLSMELGGREVLDIPSLKIPSRRITALTGPNGSGKTTLVRILGGLTRPRRGTVLYRDQDHLSRSTPRADQLRRELGIVLQSPYLFKTSVLNNVCYGLLQRGVPRIRSAARALACLEQVGLKGLERRPHDTLSGGEAQRVALARALVLEPDVLLLDEPFANVDTVSRMVIERVLLEENRRRNTSVVYTTHDLDQAYRLAEKVVTLLEGKIQDGPVENLFHGMVRQTPEGPVFDAGNIHLAVPPGREGALVASVPPESILVSTSPVATSARNTLRGRITAVRERAGTIDMTVETGTPLTARLTKQSYLEMGLVLGDEVYLIFKAEAVRLY